MISNHNFKAGDTVIFLHAQAEAHMTEGKRYLVLDKGFWSIKVLNDMGVARWVSANAFDHIPRVTATKGHLKRIVFGR